MPNFPGAKPYPLLAFRTAMVDDVAYTITHEVSIPRGGTTADYNVKLRGISERIDKLPETPYP